MTDEIDEIDELDVEGEEEKEPTVIDIIRIEVREETAPFFTEAEIKYYLAKNNGDVRATIYEMLIIKSEETTIQVSGLTTQDTSKYFRRLASRFKKINTGVLS